MLSRYDKKIIRITLNEGSTISGKAEVLPSGYALDTFGIGKECIRIQDMYIFADDIAKIEIPGEEKVTYVKMSPERVIKVVNDHLVNKNVVTEFTIGAYTD